MKPHPETKAPMGKLSDETISTIISRRYADKDSMSNLIKNHNLQTKQLRFLMGMSRHKQEHANLIMDHYNMQDHKDAGLQVDIALSAKSAADRLHATGHMLPIVQSFVKQRIHNHNVVGGHTKWMES